MTPPDGSTRNRSANRNKSSTRKCARPRPASSTGSGTARSVQDVGSERKLELLAPFRDSLPDELFTQPFELPRTSGHGRHRQDLLRARDLFEKAGWFLREGVMVNAEGEPFVIEFLTTSSTAKRTLLPYLDQLKRLGITGSIRLVESSQYVSRLRQFDYDGLLANVPYGFPPGVEIRAYFNSQVANTPNTANRAGIQSEAVDKLVSQVLDARSEEQLIAASRALDRVLLWGYYLVPIIGIQEPRVVYWNKFGRPEIDAEFVSSFPDTWWWDEVRASRIQLGEGTGSADAGRSRQRRGLVRGGQPGIGPETDIRATPISVDGNPFCICDLLTTASGLGRLHSMSGVGRQAVGGALAR